MNTYIYVYVIDEVQELLMDYLSTLHIPVVCVQDSTVLYDAIQHAMVRGIIMTSSRVITPEGQQIMKLIHKKIPSITLIERGSSHDRFIDLFVDLPLHDYAPVARISYDGFDVPMKRVGMI